MAGRFLMYIGTKAFGYFNALAFISITSTVSFFFLLKLLVVNAFPMLLHKHWVKDGFQYSIFFFIPLTVFLAIKKYRMKKLEGPAMDISLNRGVCIALVILFYLVSAILWTYIMLR
ncbi:MAG: hypothetical protein K0Q66_43 [Chitinophagaceae bacterium]|jgi:hypothetical protein|nr:hypothetical protein [Chitinophagaceae bacterium]